MIDSGWGAEVIDDARNCYADDPNEKVDVDEPRFKGQVSRNNVGFQQGKHYDEENAGEHMCNQLSHTLKIIQIKNISCKKTEKFSVVLRNYVTKDPVISCFTHVIPNEVRNPVISRFFNTRLHWILHGFAVQNDGEALTINQFLSSKF